MSGRTRTTAEPEIDGGPDAATSAPTTAVASSRRAALLDRFRSQQASDHKHLITGSGVLVIGAAVQALGGMLFSLIVAQGDTKSDFGNASALFTSVLFVTYLAGLGLPVSLARFSADRSRASHVIFTWGVLATVVSSMVASSLYLAVVHPKAAQVLWDWNPVGGFLAFAIVVLGSAFSLIVDVRCMTMRRWNLVLYRIVLVSVAKVALIPIGGQSSHRALLLFIYLGAPVAVSGIAGVFMLRRITGSGHTVGPLPPTTRPFVRYSAVNYVSTLAYQAPYFALPVIVLVNVNAATNSSFYVAWGIVAIAFYVPSAIGQALLAEGGKDGAHVRSQVRMAMWLAIGLMFVGSLATFLGKSIVIAAYGENYRDAARILPAMMAAGIPWAITSLYLTEARVLHRNVVTVIITITLTAAIIVPALILVPGHGKGHGLDGASTSWLIGNCVAAVIATATTWISRRMPDRGPSGVDPVLPGTTPGTPGNLDLA